MKKLTTLQWYFLPVMVIALGIAVFGVIDHLQQKLWFPAALCLLWAVWQALLLFDCLRWNRCGHRHEQMVGDCGDRKPVITVVVPGARFGIYEISVRTLKVKCDDCGRIRLHRPSQEDIQNAVAQIQRGEL